VVMSSGSSLVTRLSPNILLGIDIKIKRVGTQSPHPLVVMSR
jgi:hypothetical protein